MGSWESREEERQRLMGGWVATVRGFFLLSPSNQSCWWGRGSALNRRQMSAPVETPPAHTAPGQTVTFPRISQWKVLDQLARATCHSKTTREGSVA